jgi:hypothetical protein
MKSKLTATRVAQPYVGQPCSLYGKECKIVAIHPHGTIDIAAINEDKAWRITGLSSQEIWSS